MKSYKYYILILALFMVGSISILKAQELGSPSFESYDSERVRESERTSSEAADLQKANGNNSRDSLYVKLPPRNAYRPSAVVPKDAAKPKEENDNSVLSFNFLYYLIQKYKMQDIVD